MMLHRCFNFLFLLASLASCAATEGEDEIERIDALIEEYNVPVFTVQELLNGSRKNDLEAILTTTGLLSVIGTDQDMNVFNKVRQASFSGLCSCMKRENGKFAFVDGVDSSLLSDGATRISLATATVGETPLPLNVEQLEGAGCEVETVQSLDALRDYVAWASKAFVTAMDEVLKFNNKADVSILDTSHGRNFVSVSSIVKASQNLEHFHVYNKSKDATETFDLDFHTDAGLFLTFVPGMECALNENLKKADDFYIQYEGTTRRAIFQDNSIGIMMGVGVEYWLQAGMNLKATRHAVALHPGETRAWYGMMYLVPQDAIIQDFPKRTFADMRKAMVMGGLKHRSYSNTEGEDVYVDDISIGCGSSSPSSTWLANGGETRINRRRLQMVDDASACNNATNFFCWMSCLAIPDYENAAEKINSGYSLYCLDPATLVVSNVSVAHAQCNSRDHNDACIGSWQKTVPGVPSQDLHVDKESIEAANKQFCYGGTSMYMDGFHWTDSTCIIYLFPKWVLSSAGLVAAASIGTLFFGIALEAVISKRRSVVQSFPIGWRRLAISTFFYGLQLTMGYMIMLVVMTYSGPLFMCVIFGLMGGHALFNSGGLLSKESKTPIASFDNETEIERHGGSDGINSQSEVPEGITPCCQNTL